MTAFWFGFIVLRAGKCPHCKSVIPPKITGAVFLGESATMAEDWSKQEVNSNDVMNVAVAMSDNCSLAYQTYIEGKLSTEGLPADWSRDEQTYARRLMAWVTLSLIQRPGFLSVGRAIDMENQFHPGSDHAPVAEEV